MIHTPIADPSPYSVDYAARFDVEYEAKINDGTKPYFGYNLQPYAATCIQNCKTDLKFTVDGSSCSLTWDPSLDTTDANGRYHARSCTLTNKGLNSNRSIKIDNDGKVELQGGTPYGED